MRDESGAVVKWYGVNTDIEDLKRAEAELQRRSALLHQGEAVSETGSFHWRIETERNQLVRPAPSESSSSSAGTPVTLELIASRVHPEDAPLLEDMVNRAQAGRDFEFHHRLLMPDGSVKYLHLDAHATRDPAGRLEYIGAAQDVTERRMSEQALSKVRSELTHLARVSSLGALAASIAHEVNQPLSGIITNASTCIRMLGAEPPNLDGARETARRMIRDGNRASEVVARLRPLFTKGSVSIDSVDLNEAAREVIALSVSDLQRKGVVVREELEDELPPVAGDRVQLQQVILNLVLNASDAMSTLDDRPRNLLVKTARDDANRVRLSVCDSGIGIDPQNRRRSFSMRSIRPRATGWASASRSAARSSRVTTVGSGRPRTTDPARHLRLRFPADQSRRPAIRNRIHQASNRTQSLPNKRPLSIVRRASGTSSNANVRSITGFSFHCSMCASMSVNCARLPTDMPSNCRLLLKSIGNEIVLPKPLRTPITMMRPPTRAASIDCCSVFSPPTSMTTSTPRPSVKRRASADQSGYFV